MDWSACCVLSSCPLYSTMGYSGGEALRGTFIGSVVFSSQVSFLQCLFPFCFHIMNWLFNLVSCVFVLSQKISVPFTNCLNIFIIIPLNSVTSILSESLSRGATTLDLLIWEKTHSPDISCSFCLCTWICPCEVRWLVKVFDSFQLTTLLSGRAL